MEKVLETAAAPAADAGGVPRGRWHPELLAWFALGLLLLVQGIIFHRVAAAEAAGILPRGYDQTRFLHHSYRAYDALSRHGLAGLVRYGLEHPLPNGLVLHLHAALLYVLLGPSRVSALSLNFAWFAAFQLALAATLYWRTRLWAVVFFGVGLLSSAATPFSPTGGLADFRNDFSACCLFGIFLCAVVRSDYFASRRWALAAGAVAALLVLYRPITAAYLAGIFGAAVLFFVFQKYHGRADRTTRDAALRRLTGLLLAGGLLAAAAGPVLIASRQALWDYYVVTHVLTADKDVRAAEHGVFSPSQSLLFYARSVRQDHAGRYFAALAGLGLAAAAWLGWRRRAVRAAAPSCRPRSGTPAAWFVLGCCVLVPYALLTLDVSKTPSVAGIMLPPLLWLCLLPLLRVTDRGVPGSPASSGVLTLLAAAAVVTGVWSQAGKARHGGFWRRQGDDVRQLTALHDALIAHCRTAGLTRPTLAVDTAHPFLNGGAFDVVARERHGTDLEVRQLLGNGVLAVGEAWVLEALRESDVVILTAGPPLGERCYPFHQEVEALRPRMREFCEKNRVLVKEFPVAGSLLRLYVRPASARPGPGG
jgi:hypothetical protein